MGGGVKICCPSPLKKNTEGLHPPISPRVYATATNSECNDDVQYSDL